MSQLPRAGPATETATNGPVREVGAPGAPPVAPANELQLVAERVLLSALREQDARAAAEVARQRAEFLDRASVRLGASLDEELTFAAIAGLPLPGLDAWCIVDVIEVGGGLRRLAIVHPDVEKQALARALAGSWKPAPHDRIGVPVVAADRVPVTVADPAALLGDARDPERRDALERLGVGALLVVPAVAHGVLFGAITYVSRPTVSSYRPEDVALAEAMAARCGQALESARLYAAARAAWAEAAAARTEADLANAAKGRFLAHMSHELQTPLTAIGGYAQLIELGIHGPITAAQRDALARLQRSQRHMIGIVRDVLQFARIESGQLVYELRETPLAPVVTDALPMVEPQLEAKGIALDVRLGDPAASPVVWADSDKLVQVIINLLGNAAKFTPPGGRVVVEITDRDPAAGDPGPPDLVYVRVVDTGCGIADSKLEAIFEPFVQVGKPASEGGTGLGLAISRELARGMGGDLRARNAAGGGASLTLALRRVTTATGEPVERRIRDERRESDERRTGRRRGDGSSAPASDSDGRAVS